MLPNKISSERFFQACRNGDLNIIKINLFHNVSPFVQDKYGNNALHLTCMSNQPKILEYLLKTVKTYKNDVQNKLGRSALNIAASQGAFECIDILLNNLHCNINSADKIFKNTPLHWCVISKCIIGVKHLLNRGADYMLINKFGKTPLELARSTCLDIFYLIEEFIKNKNKDQYFPKTCQTNGNITNNNNPKSSSNNGHFQIIDKLSKSNPKVFKNTINHRNSSNCETTLEPDLSSSTSNESFFLDISKLKHGDNSVLKLLEKSIEPVDETSFVSSILNSGKVIQLTEAGILALEYTKNEVNISIPDRVVQSFLNTSQLYSENNKHDSDNKTSKKDNELNTITSAKGLKRLKSPLPYSGKMKYAKMSPNKISEIENLLEQSSSKYTKTFSDIHNFSTLCSQSSSSVENTGNKNNEIYNTNQLVCLNSDMNAQHKWIEDIMCLLHKLENSDFVENKSIEPA